MQNGVVQAMACAMFSVFLCEKESVLTYGEILRSFSD